MNGLAAAHNFIPTTTIIPLTTNTPTAFISGAPHGAFGPINHIKPLPRTPTEPPRINDLPLASDLKTPPSLNPKGDLNHKLAINPKRAESLLNNLIDNPEYGELAKTVLTSVATSIEIGKFVHTALKDYNIASTLAGNGIMAAVISSAVVIGGGQIAQKIPGSRAALQAKTEYCVKKLTEELEARERIQQRLDDIGHDTPLVPGTPAFDAAVEVCVQELRGVPSSNNLTVGRLRVFVQDLFAHIRALIDLVRGQSASPREP
jgi:hypothetical protein